MRTPQWIKKLGGFAGELYVAAEFAKRGICVALLPENFPEDDLMIANRDGSEVGYVQVKACHPKRASTFILHATDEKWADLDSNNASKRFVVFVDLGNPDRNGNPSYWIATRVEVGNACISHPAHGTDNWERRFGKKDLIVKGWENRWSLFDKFLPGLGGLKGAKPL